MGNIIHRNIQQELPRAVSGDGVYLIDQDGNRYLDGCCGAAVSCLGHSNKVVVEAIKTQLDALPYAHTSFFTTDVAEELAELLSGRTDGALDKVYFVSGGSEATADARGSGDPASAGAIRAGAATVGDDARGAPARPGR